MIEEPIKYLYQWYVVKYKCSNNPVEIKSIIKKDRLGFPWSLLTKITFNKI